MQNFIAPMLLALLVLAWSTAQVIGADVRVCSGESVIDSRLTDPFLFQQDLYPKNSCVIAQSLLGDHGKQPKEQWERDRKLEAEKLERIRRWDEYGKMRRCKQSCYDIYRSCAFFSVYNRSRICQLNFDNCIRSCE